MVQWTQLQCDRGAGILVRAAFITRTQINRVSMAAYILELCAIDWSVCLLESNGRRGELCARCCMGNNMRVRGLQGLAACDVGGVGDDDSAVVVGLGGQRGHAEHRPELRTRRDLHQGASVSSSPRG